MCNEEILFGAKVFPYFLRTIAKREIEFLFVRRDIFYLECRRPVLNISLCCEIFLVFRLQLLFPEIFFQTFYFMIL